MRPRGRGGPELSLVAEMRSRTPEFPVTSKLEHQPRFELSLMQWLSVLVKQAAFANYKRRSN